MTCSFQPQYRELKAKIVSSASILLTKIKNKIVTWKYLCIGIWKNFGRKIRWCELLSISRYLKNFARVRVRTDIQTECIYTFQLSWNQSESNKNIRMYYSFFKLHLHFISNIFIFTCYEKENLFKKKCLNFLCASMKTSVLPVVKIRPQLI